MQSAVEPIGAQPARRPSTRPIKPRTVLALLAIAALWQILSSFFPVYLVPGFQKLVPSLLQVLQDSSSYYHFLTTIVRVVVGCTVASLLGLLLGIVMGVNKSIEDFLLPPLRFIMGIPALSWVLLVVIWFREPELRVFAILVVICLPVIALNVLEGIKNTPKDLYEMALSFRPSGQQVVRMIILPWVMPFFMVGLKVALSLAARIVVFAELLGANLGIGAAMYSAFTLFDVAGVLVWSVLLVLILYLLDFGTGRADRFLFRWRPAVVQRDRKEV